MAHSGVSKPGFDSQSRALALSVEGGTSEILVMRFAEKLLEGYIQRLSQEEKEALFTRIVEHFFREMTPEQKQRLVEQAITRLLEGIDMQEFLPRLLAILWKIRIPKRYARAFWTK